MQSVPFQGVSLIHQTPLPILKWLSEWEAAAWEKEQKKAWLTRQVFSILLVPLRCVIRTSPYIKIQSQQLAHTHLGNWKVMDGKNPKEVFNWI